VGSAASQRARKLGDFGQAASVTALQPRAHHARGHPLLARGLEGSTRRGSVGWPSSAVKGLNRWGVAHVTDRQDERRARSEWWGAAALFVRAERARHPCRVFINGRGEHCVRGHGETGKLSPGGGN